MWDVDKERTKNIRGISRVALNSHEIALKVAISFEQLLLQSGYIDFISMVNMNATTGYRTGLKLKLSKGDVTTVQGDGGWSTPDMVTKRYSKILDEDRRNLAAEMEQKFYQRGSIPSTPTSLAETPAFLGANELAAILANNPNLQIQVLQSVQSANPR